MKAAQITKYSKDIHLIINEVDIPKIKDNEVLVKVKAAGVNPVDILIANGICCQDPTRFKQHHFCLHKAC